MKAAIDEAIAGVDAAHGGPFGAAVVHNGTVIAVGHNNVVATHDPTAHAEILAIRAACEKLGRFDLSDCELYTTCEPCPMCYAAAWWARIRTIYYGCSRDDAAEIGFDDAAIYDDLEGKTDRQVNMLQIERDGCLVPMQRWESRPDRVPY